MENNQVQYFNDAQQFLVSMNANTTVAVCGRGFGKGAVQAARLLTAVQGMPGSCGGFVAPAARRCLTNILPSILIHLERWGYRRDTHYVVGRRPPKNAGWKSPIFTPDDWNNAISFYNGAVCNIISQDRTGTSNSMSLDYLIIDEAKFIDPEKLRKETLPANRGNEQYFGHFFMHHGMTITSDMPVTNKGSWFLDYEKSMNIDIVNALWAVCNKIRLINNQLKASPYSVELLQQREKWRKVRDSLRKECILYCEFTTLENIDLLGEDFIRRLKRDLSGMLFDTSVMSKRAKFARDGFYSSLDEDVNFYTAPNLDKLKLKDVGTDNLVDDCRLDADLIPNQPIYIAFDANSLFNGLVCGQLKDNYIKVLKSFFTKNDRKLTDLVDDFCEYYKYHRKKTVVFYFDATFKGSTTGLHKHELYVIVSSQFRLNGWKVQKKFIGAPMKHTDKNLMINEMFRGRRRYTPKINRDNNEDLIIALANAKVKNGKKDKSAEKDTVETEETLREHRTDFTDAFDTLLIGVESFPVWVSHSTAPNGYG